jgi:hypothetical protein
VYPTTFYTTASKRDVPILVTKNVRYKYEDPPPGSVIIRIRL